MLCIEYIVQVHVKFYSYFQSSSACRLAKILHVLRTKLTRLAADARRCTLFAVDAIAGQNNLIILWGGGAVLRFVLKVDTGRKGTEKIRLFSYHPF